jgi:hypothetical protein
VRLDTSRSNVARIEKGRTPSAETLTRLAAALDVESGKGALWGSHGRGWLLGALAIAALVFVLVIAGLRSSGTNSGASSEQLPDAVSVAPGAPAPVVRVDAHGTPLRATRKEAKAQKTKGASPRHERGDATDQEPPQSPPKAKLTPTSPTTPVPSPPSDAASPQPPGSGSPSAPPQPTGKPEGSPGNGPGGGGSGGGNGPGGSGPGGNGPGGTGPPGQLR